MSAKRAKITWLYKAPDKVSPTDALRIIARILHGTGSEHIATALRHRKRYPNNPAGHCGLSTWIRAVIKSEKVGARKRNTLPSMPQRHTFRAAKEGERAMILTKEQAAGMLEAAKPLMKWLSDNCHPHCEATVEADSVELKEGVAREITDQFIKG